MISSSWPQIAPIPESIQNVKKDNTQSFHHLQKSEEQNNHVVSNVQAGFIVFDPNSSLADSFKSSNFHIELEEHKILETMYRSLEAASFNVDSDGNPTKSAIILQAYLSKVSLDHFINIYSQVLKEYDELDPKSKKEFNTKLIKKFLG